MRLPQNKARATENKAPSVGTMNGALQKVMDAAAAIQCEAPQTRAEYVQGIIDAQDAQKAAQDAKDEAETPADFDKACDDATRAREKEAFYRRKLEALDFTPRMEETEYFALVESVSDVMKASADNFRKTAQKAVEELKAARMELEKNAADADKVLIALDEAANVLQCKYRYRVTHYLGAPDTRKEDRGEWTRHRKLYTERGTIYRMATAGSVPFAKAWDTAGAAIQKI